VDSIFKKTRQIRQLKGMSIMSLFRSLGLHEHRVSEAARPQRLETLRSVINYRSDTPDRMRTLPPIVVVGTVVLLLAGLVLGTYLGSSSRAAPTVTRRSLVEAGNSSGTVYDRMAINRLANTSRKAATSAERVRS
jgi:hypothetical protein